MRLPYVTDYRIRRPTSIPYSIPWTFSPDNLEGTLAGWTDKFILRSLAVDRIGRPHGNLGSLGEAKFSKDAMNTVFYAHLADPQLKRYFFVTKAER
jgi:hypothetical protein